MPPRPSLQSLLLMAASTSASAGAGGSGLLLAACRCFPAAGGHRVRLLHSFPSRTRLPRRPELACCFGTAPAEAVPAAPRARNVRSMEERRACEERLGQVVEKMKKEGIDMSQWTVGTFQWKICPQCEGGSTEERSLTVFIREDGTNGNWTCHRANCGWKGYTQPDGVLKAYQAKKDSGNENGSDQEVKANQSEVRSMEERRVCKERLGQVVEKMRKEGIDMSQWTVGTFQWKICPQCEGGSTEERSLTVFIREDGTNGNWTCRRANCGWKGYTQVYQAKKEPGTRKSKQINLRV